MVMKQMVIAAAVVAAATIGTVHAAELEARLARATVASGEAFELRLRTVGRDGAVPPQLQPLEADFDVLGTAQSTRTSIINGVREDSTEWIVTLAPKRAGKLEIPALHAGGASSDPVFVEVVDVADRTPATSASVAGEATGLPAVFAEAELDELAPYVQGETRLTFRLHSDRPIVRGSIHEPSIDGVEMERIGKDRIYEKDLDGRHYQVVEREYVVSPQRSGELVIPGVLFDGVVEAPAADPRDRSDRVVGGGSFGDPFASSMFQDFFRRSGGAGMAGGLLDEMFGPRGNAVRVRSPELVLDVKAKPADAAGRWWLPARHVELDESWDSPPDGMNVGDQATRTITIRAIGASDRQLPAIDLPEVAGLKQYSQPAGHDTVKVDGQVVALKSVETVLIPTRDGTITLPEVRLEWWDSAADEQRTATLPARTLQIGPAKGAPAAVSGTPTGSGSVLSPGSGGSAAQAAIGGAIGEGEAQGAQPGASPADAPWSVVLATFAGSLFVAAMLVLAIRRRRSRDASPVAALADRLADAVAAEAGGRRGELMKLERDLKNACVAGDARRARAALSAVSSLRWPGRTAPGLASTAPPSCDSTLRVAIDELNRSCYADRDAAEHGWDGRPLWRAYRHAARQASKERKAQARAQSGRGPLMSLPELYPSR